MNSAWLKQPNTAVLLIDFINPLDFRGGAPLKPLVMAAAQRTARLRARVRRAGLPWIYIKDHFGHWYKSFAELLDWVARANPFAADVCSLLAPEPGDIALLKPRHSAFYGTALECLLAERGIDQLILTGLTTDNCVFATAQDAYVRKFKLWIPADCVAALPSAHPTEVLRHMAHTMKARIGRVR